MAKVNFFNSTARPSDSRRESQQKGVTGEQLASAFLEDRGYVILERNYRFGKNEVDIIALDASELVIVEVKTRTDSTFGSPEEAVDSRKRASIVRVANHYILSHQRREPVRFDIVAILLADDGHSEVHHLKNAFDVFSYKW